ncbi:unnamed protein product [Blepharisma stoltei]|uniref:DNA topoisomerase 2 n=1 Tax=Blepharisma stoltei TaxID=1481888 RepID=A0AAU9JUK3_9CILI|nr:unnamed protein product [Blepharisma stoltei]
MAGNDSDSGTSTIEQIYQKKTPLEHILLRPDTYVGSIEMQENKLWVWDSEQNTMVFRQIQYVPGLYKIFDEILVNAADNYQRDKKMNKIDVTLDPERGMISVWNNGKGIPVAVHQEYGIYVPELIFGQLLTSSNYDDTKKKTTGGRNGYGAKLANVFSKRFIIETADSERMQKFSMEWTDNMSKKSHPTITKLKKSEDYTCITFYPDLERFGMSSLNKDILDLMTKRVYDMAGSTGKSVKVFLNQKEISIKNFKDYIDLYIKDPTMPKIYENPSERWEVGISISEGVFQQVSFVNSICTSKGGTHVNHVADQLINAISGAIQKKNKKLDIKNNQIKQHLWVFVNSLVENPCFDSQTKETMTLKPSSFGSKCELSEKFIKEVVNCGIIDHVVAFAKAKTEAQLGKKVKSKKNEKIYLNKLEDANLAGTKNSRECTLILTEGDSAKTLAVAGIEVVGRDKFGAFPLKGKLLNVREASHKQLMANEEIQNIMKIVGLQPKKEYEDLGELRYGCIMIMADQDLDGSHIKGLIINLIHFFWPGLLKTTGFVKEFITPIVKATKGHDSISFYTLHEYEAWSKAEDRKSWNIKYYKGLGTSTSKEAREYFGNIQRHRIEFLYDNDQRDGDAIDMAFNKKRSDDRKRWLAALDPDTFLDMSEPQISVSDFINRELILFSNYDNIRSIPSVVDGLKPGQRKIIFSCFKRKLKGEIKVAQLAGYVGEHSAYHHGEQSLATTIVGLAQNFVGSNNINLLLPIGQFGTRLLGGKDMASPRYIFTNLSQVTRKMFILEDDYLLNYQKEEGQKIEPNWYVPIIPLVLINGADGIGTGWSTCIPPYNPIELIQVYRDRINGNSFDGIRLKPWFKGYTGTLDWIEGNGGGYEIKGVFERLDGNILRITELPIGKWTTDYKKFLEELAQAENPIVTDIKEYHTENRIDFHIEVPTLQHFSDSEIMKIFKLQSSLSMNNLVLFNPERKIKKYPGIKEILEEHYTIREDFYEKRKEFLVSQTTAEVTIISNKVRFILEVINNELIINKKQKAILITELKRKGFTTKSELEKIFKDPKIHQVEDKETEQENDEVVESGTIKAKEYDYLLGMPLWSLTYEKVEQLKKEEQEKIHELETLKNTSIYDMWGKDLDELKKVIEEEWENEERERNKVPAVKGKTKKTAKRATKVPAREKKDNLKQTTIKPPTKIITQSDDERKGKIRKINISKEKGYEVIEDITAATSESSDFKNPLGARKRKNSIEDTKNKKSKLMPNAEMIIASESEDEEFEL